MQITSKHQTIHYDSVTLSPPGDSADITISLKSDILRKAGPTAIITAWYIDDNCEIIADSIIFKVDEVFNNQVFSYFILTKPN